MRRRVELDPRYTNRRTFTRDRGIDYRIASDMEAGRRGNYEAATLAAAELAYRLAPGSLATALAGGELEFEPVAAPASLRPVPDLPPSGTPAERERDRLLAEYPDDEVLRVIAGQTGKKVSMVVAEMLDWRGTQETPPPHARNGTAG